MPALALTSSSITQEQALVNNIGVANRQMVNVSSKLYYITKRQIPFNTADSLAVAYGSDTTGLVWSLLASTATGPNSPVGGSATEFSIVAVGTKIYLADFTPTQAGVGSGNFRLGIWTFDTVAGTWSGPGPGGPFAHDTIAVSMTALNSGLLLLVYSVAADAFGNVNAFNAVTYNPGTTTWGAAFTVDAAGTSQAVAQIHDTASDHTIVYYNKGGTNSLLAAVMDSTPSVLTNTAALFTFGGGFQFIEVWGLAAVTSDSPSGGISAALPFVTGGPPICRVIFVNFTTFATATETVDDTTDLPVGSQIQVYDQQDQPGSAALDFGGTLYVTFVVDNGDLDSAASQAFLYAKNRTGGVWGGLQILFTSVLSRELLAPFPAPWNVNGPAIMVQAWDPTKNIFTAPDTSGLTSFILLPAPAPPPVANVTLPGGGGDQVERGGCRPFNHYDWCLLREIAKLRRIKPLPPCSVPPELWNVLPWEFDWGSVPALAVPFRKILSIPTPTTAAGDTTVVLDVVPQGYDGILTGFYWRYNGLNFIEGSGDIFWRIQINQRFVKDLSNVGFTLGAAQTPFPLIGGGQLLQSHQRFSVVVNVPNLSGTIQIGSATITAGMFGFFWPKGVPGWTSR